MLGNIIKLNGSGPKNSDKCDWKNKCLGHRKGKHWRHDDGEQQSAGTGRSAQSVSITSQVHSVQQLAPCAWCCSLGIPLAFPSQPARAPHTQTSLPQPLQL